MSNNGDLRPSHADRATGGMDIFDGLKVLIRRWYVVLPILLVTAILAVSTHKQTSKSYTGEVILGITTGSISRSEPVPSGSPTVSRFNALVQSGGTTLIANLLTIGLQQPSAVATVAAQGGTPGYTVAVLERDKSFSQLPLITITATSTSPKRVLTTLNAVQQLAAPTLQTIQASAGIPKSKFATPFVVQTITSPSVEIPSKLRATASVVVAGLVIAVAFAAVVDAIVRRRRRRPSRRSEPNQETSSNSVKAAVR